MTPCQASDIVRNPLDYEQDAIRLAAQQLGRLGGLAGKGKPGRIEAARKGGLAKAAKARAARMESDPT